MYLKHAQLILLEQLRSPLHGMGLVATEALPPATTTHLQWLLSDHAHCVFYTSSDISLLLRLHSAD